MTSSGIQIIFLSWDEYDWRTEKVLTVVNKKTQAIKWRYTHWQQN